MKITFPSAIAMVLLLAFGGAFTATVANAQADKAKSAFEAASAAFVRKDFVAATQQLTIACEAGLRDACFYLADQYVKGVGVTEDKARAAALYEKACHDGLLNACKSLGAFYNVSPDAAADESLRLTVLGKACDDGLVMACVHLAQWLDLGKDSVENRPAVAKLYAKACDSGIAKGCRELAGKALQGWGIPQDVGRAISLLRKACLLDPNDTSSRRILRELGETP